MRFFSIILMVLVLIMAGCAPRQSGNVYSRSQAQQQLSVYYGTVLVVNTVTIEGTQTGLGTIAGGVVGGIAGNTVGGGHGRALATAVGAIGGALVGSAVEEGTTRQNGLELTVELDSGEVIAVVQEADDYYAVGDRVRIIRGPGGVTRVRQ
ncbi:glycine zipper 2TM domain-containing protein [uncultured Desulfuromonas sp.]|uniref:glycine zipper 2TM domain-containing protein n=1 Tax=uncultured Desulfuromonas sp. TaxID=181013 RepID=UPI002AAB7340|nr:glycine zipper 2TM domain-containing protein [uncultured Desulfuromonas sp.]